MQDFPVLGRKYVMGLLFMMCLHHAEQLPWGIRDHQTPGGYQLVTIPEQKAFAFANGPQAIKPILFKPQETVWKVVRNNEGKLTFQPHQPSEITCRYYWRTFL